MSSEALFAVDLLPISSQYSSTTTAYTTLLCAIPTMASELLSTVSSEPALLRWLHSHDPDRDLNHDLLQSSATFTTSVPTAESQAVSGSALPPTASLFVPMYRREHFVLGQLYGPMSPNAMALNMLAQAGYGQPPHPICRRFVVDLSFTDSLQFIEYEWFSDGKLCVSMHSVRKGDYYEGESILLDCESTQDRLAEISKDDLFTGRRFPSPTRVIMRLRITETSRCLKCGTNGADRCVCPPSMLLQYRNPEDFVTPSNWETWLSAFSNSRIGLAQMRVNFSLRTPVGNKHGSMAVPLRQSCEVGVDSQSPQGNLLLRMFMQSADMLVSHPRTDIPVVAVEVKRERIELANELSKEDENWAQPQILELETECDEKTTDQWQYDLANQIQPQMSSTLSTRAGQALPVAAASSSSRPLEQKGQHRATPSNHLWSMPKQCDNVTTSMAASTKIQKALRISEQGTQKESKNAKRKGLMKSKLLLCECGKVFRHRGHFNEHRLCVHEKVRQHGCLSADCQR